MTLILLEQITDCLLLHMPGTILDAKDRALNSTDRCLCLWGLHFSGRRKTHNMSDGNKCFGERMIGR